MRRGSADSHRLKEGSLTIYTYLMETIAALRRDTDFCDCLTEGQDDMAREILSQAASQWTLWVLHVLAENGAPLRFTRVLERVEGVSQKVLTQTLRKLERDGLVTRTLYPQVPPRVEYQLTALGQALLQQVAPVWRWVAENISAFEAARLRFDAEKAGRDRV